MVARLVEGLYFKASGSPPATDIDFILRELRTPELLIEAVTRFPQASRNIATGRPAVQAALSGDIEQVRVALRVEQDEAIRREYHRREPLKRELEQFRHQR